MRISKEQRSVILREYRDSDGYWIDLRAETDPEKLGLYARIILRQAPAARRPTMRERLEALGLLG